MMNKQDLCLAIGASFKAYQQSGARSTAKLIPLHQFIAESILSVWGEGYEVNYMGEGNKEQKVLGKYYPKDIDITITKAGKTILCVGVKFVMSNYKKNSNNYFENMMGETANIQAASIPYAQFIILRHETPLYKVAESQQYTIEVINQKDLQKYVNLMYDYVQAHRPFATAIVLIDIDEATTQTTLLDMKTILGTDFGTLMHNKLSVENLMEEIANLRRYIETQ